MKSAAIGVEQIKKLPGFLNRREQNFYFLKKMLEEIAELELLESSSGRFKSSYYCLSVVLKRDLQDKRSDIMNAMKAEGVGTSVYYPQPVPRMSYYQGKYGYERQKYPMAERISDRSIALPVGPHLDEEDMVLVVDSLKRAILKV